MADVELRRATVQAGVPQGEEVECIRVEVAIAVSNGMAPRVVRRERKTVEVALAQLQLQSVVIPRIWVGKQARRIARGEGIRLEEIDRK